MMGRVHTAIALLALTSSARAADAAPDLSLGSGLGQTTLWLCVVLALIWGTAWVVKRVAPMQGGSNSLVKVVATQAVGQRERVVVVEIKDTWLVLGVAPGRVNSLHVLPKSTSPETVAPNPSFGSLLARIRNPPQE